MLERGEQPVAAALIGLAARLQQQQATAAAGGGGGGGGAEAVLMREACYRCIGEGYNHVSSHINFAAWYQGELRPQLEQRLPAFLSGSADLFAAVLQARALWLVGVCGSDLPRPLWTQACDLVIRHMGARDLVVALMAVSSAMGLAALILDDQQKLEQAEAAHKPAAALGGGAGGGALQFKEVMEALQEVRAAGWLPGWLVGWRRVLVALGALYVGVTHMVRRTWVRAPHHKHSHSTMHLPQNLLPASSLPGLVGVPPRAAAAAAAAVDAPCHRRRRHRRAS